MAIEWSNLIMFDDRLSITSHDGACLRRVTSIISDQVVRRQELTDDSYSSYQPPPDSDSEMSWWCEEMMNLLVMEGWSESLDMPAPLGIIPPLHEHESDPHSNSTPGPSQAHHTPAETPLSIEEFMAMIMSFDATAGATEAEVAAAAPHLHSRLSNVCLLHQVDPPPLPRIQYTPYEILDRPDIHRGKHCLTDDVENHAGPSQHSPMLGVPPPAVPLLAIPVPPPAVPLAIPVPPPAAPLSTTSESLPSLAVPIGLGNLVPQVKLRAKQCMKQSMFDDSFLLSAQKRSEKVLASLIAVISTFNNPELVLWSLGSEAKKDADKIGETAKYLRKQVKDIVRTAVLFGYDLNDALATQTQEEMEVTIRNLLQGDTFLNGDIKVGGQTILGMPFGNRVVRHFMQHILFYQLNLQQYISPS
ncbi:uncharacterized protein F5891DRAFT_977191 [Suillus fuscotomentosus]|uniref:Uncharacterized protein n=1 Tax=Suillus fuscotomentosus TaxID=1912939 RepID=A0AAD4EDP9_9AGAM|nr:uncharacterized protein F5891DRAFT_977191 [Suillus fuscotomentosus]KAG1904329.1 hypothetical protein F5891DRAFT_977191 [Suillus fuscotomentosus]